MSVFDPKICQDGHTDKMQCLESERDRLKAELVKGSEIYNDLAKECHSLAVDLDSCKLKAETLAEALKKVAGAGSTVWTYELNALAKEALAEYEETK